MPGVFAQIQFDQKCVQKKEVKQVHPLCKANNFKTKCHVNFQSDFTAFGSEKSCFKEKDVFDKFKLRFLSTN